MLYFLAGMLCGAAGAVLFIAYQLNRRVEEMRSKMRREDRLRELRGDPKENEHRD